MQRCKAKSKRSEEQCKNYAIKTWGVCRMHGAKGGPKTKAGIIKCTIEPFKHGCYSKEVLEEVRFMKKSLKNITGYRISSKLMASYNVNHCD